MTYILGCDCWAGQQPYSGQHLINNKRQCVCLWCKLFALCFSSARLVSVPLYYVFHRSIRWNINTTQQRIYNVNFTSSRRFDLQQERLLWVGTTININTRRLKLLFWNYRASQAIKNRQWTKTVKQTEIRGKSKRPREIDEEMECKSSCPVTVLLCNYFIFKFTTILWMGGLFAHGRRLAGRWFIGGSWCC